MHHTLKGVASHESKAAWHRHSGEEPAPYPDTGPESRGGAWTPRPTAWQN